MSIAKKITLLFAILSGVIISLLSGFVWYFSNEFAFEDFYKRLEARVNIYAQIKLSNDINNPVYAQMRNQYLERLPSEKEYITQIDSEKLAKVNTDDILPITFYNRIKAGYVGRYRAENHFYAGKLFKIDGKEYIVIVSANDPIGFRELRDLQKTLIIGFFLSVFLSFLVGWRFSNYMLTPLRKIIKSVKKIKAENLHLRLDVKEGKDEMSELAQTFNNMLNRLETAFETQNNFISNASHELRTPLTIISGEVELAERSIDDKEKQAKALKTIKYETNRLEHIITSLLSMAQTGFNGTTLPWETVRMDEVLWETKASIQQVHPESNIEFNFDNLPEDESQLNIKVIASLIKLAISNVVSNACKYSGYKPVTITLESKEGILSITISDQGIGIPQSDIEHIYEPFFRASNTHNHYGYGIGLPLTLNIVKLHRGSIDIKSEVNIGTEIKILLPLTSP